MCAEAVDRRLRQAAALAKASLATPEGRAQQRRMLEEAEAQKRMQRVSMTPEAVARRLREASELLKLCQALRAARGR